MSEQSEANVRAPVVRTPGGGRRVAVFVTLIFAGLLLLLTSFAVWVDRVALNTDQFVDTSSELIEDDAIRQAVATRAVDELYANVDVDDAIEERLTKDLKPLAAPTAAGLRQVAPEILDRALEQPALQRVWEAMIRQTHEELADVLEGGGSTVSTEEGVVVLDFRPIVLETADRIGLRDEVAKRLPQDAAQIEVLRSDQLDTAQNAFQLLETLAWVLPIFTLAAFGIALLLAAGGRRLAVRGIGITIFVVGILGLVAVNLTGDYVVDSLVSDTETRDAADNAWGILTGLLRSSFRWFLVVGVLFVVAAWLAGPRPSARTTRQAITPLIRERLYPYAALAVVALILLVTGPVSDFARILSVVVIVGLLASGIEVLRRQTLQEFPNAEMPVLFDEARERMSGWFEMKRAASPSGAGPAAPAPADVTTQLVQLAELHASGALTDAEFAVAKARVLAGE